MSLKRAVRTETKQPIRHRRALGTLTLAVGAILPTFGVGITKRRTQMFLRASRYIGASLHTFH